jgi:putative nucleotidyltransferase with HDIG domain
MRWLITAQSVAAAAAAIVWHDLPGRSQLPLVAILAALALAAGALKVELCARWGRITMAFAVAYFTFLTLGPGAAMLVNSLAAVGGLCFNQRERRRRFNLGSVPAYRLAFNISNYVLCIAAAEIAFQLVGGRRATQDLQQLAVPVFASSLAYYLTNTWGVAAALAWTQDRRPLAVWRENFAWAWAGYLATACGVTGGIALWPHISVGPAALLLLPPCYLIFQSYRIHVNKIRADAEHMRAVNRLSQSIITSLAMAIDAKDRTTHRHVHRVREYAIAVAEKLSIDGAELEAIKIAALLHDIGKLGISERILCKPDKLTREEFAIIQGHVELGARILEPVDFPWPVIPIVLTHHERWDGLGYPRGLAGADIPMGGRIVALADVYDALTSDRPYRKAMSRDSALELIRSGSGSQFDARVVSAFEQVLPAVEDRIRRLEAEARLQPAGKPWPARDLARGAPLLQARQEPVSSPRPVAPPDQEEALALDQALDWCCSAVWSGLPASTVCVYLPADDPCRLRSVRCEGLGAARWRGAEILIGEGAVGHAVAQRKTVINAPAWLDLSRRVEPGENLDLATALVVPLLTENACLGALAIYHTGYDIYDESHAREAERIARCVAPLVSRFPPGSPPVAVKADPASDCQTSVEEQSGASALSRG